MASYNLLVLERTLFPTRGKTKQNALRERWDPRTGHQTVVQLRLIDIDGTELRF